MEHWTEQKVCRYRLFWGDTYGDDNDHNDGHDLPVRAEAYYHGSFFLILNEWNNGMIPKS